MPKARTENGERSLAETAYARLRSAIDSGRFHPGDRMREAELADWLGISRTPVRDALKRLENDGLVSAAPRRGLVVTQLEQEQVSELYAVRQVLEGLAGRLAAQHASAAEIEAMRELLERQERTKADPFALARLNRLFHDVVYRASHNRFLISTLDIFEGSLALLPGTTYATPGRPKTALKEHAAIVAAIAKRDVQRAEQAALLHMRNAERLRLLMISGALDGHRAPRRARRADA